MEEKKEQKICAEHINDDNLKLFIEEKGTMGKCEYCHKKTKIIEFSSLAEYVKERLNVLYKIKDDWGSDGEKSSDNIWGKENNNGKNEKEFIPSSPIVYPDDYSEVIYPNEIVAGITSEPSIRSEFESFFCGKKFERRKFEYNDKQYKDLWEMFVDYVRNKNQFSVDDIVKEAQMMKTHKTGDNHEE